ncbi:phosphoglycerate mutase family domain protein [Neofusicoccum parvum]|nr:phosphoglycerate mutase family domain protein [Neofusicoccum parvum]
MIILIRHAQSEGNKNRDIHQFIPDHRVKLTPDGWQQAEDAGRRLRSLLRPDDTLQFFTSPYRRTRETTEGILRTLTSDSPTPSPFPRQQIKVYEEPRLREQDFGNFQPCSAEMERMWQERADYGHFFYRIPNGESAADAYDRVSGFNESMWRLFGEEDFPSVCVLVTHGLMTRVFLMKWYHWSVEYFEDLRNINHCEFIIMKQNTDNGKFILENKLRTWSDLKRRTAATSSAHEGNGAPASSDVDDTPGSSDADSANQKSAPHAFLRLHPGRDFGGSHSGAGTPAEGFSDDSDYFSSARLRGCSSHRERSKVRRRNEKTWKEESGMGAGVRADALGDGDSGDEAEDDDDGEAELTGGDNLTEEERDEIIENAKLKSRKGFGEVY